MHFLQRCAEGFCRSSIAACAMAALFVFLSVPCSAQLSSASVNGTIRDQKGAVIPNATVLLHNVDTNVDRQIGGGGQRANQVGNPHLSHRSTAEWFNTAAFALPPLYTFGNAGRNTLRAQRYITLDTSVIRAFPFWREGVFEFRAEAFNIFNHPVFGRPNNDVFSPNFGSVSSTADNPRQMQFSGKIVF